MYTWKCQRTPRPDIPCPTSRSTINHKLWHKQCRTCLPLHEKLRFFNTFIPFAGCSESYNISLWPSMRNINSQVAEQRNASLKALAKMLSYMSQENFMLMLTSHIWFRNMLQICQQSPCSQYAEYFSRLKSTYCKTLSVWFFLEYCMITKIAMLCKNNIWNHSFELFIYMVE